MTTKLDNFNLLHGYVSTEALSVHLPNRNLLNNFSSMINAFSDYMSDKLPELEQTTLKEINVNLSKSQITEIVAIPYKDLKDLMVSVPEGLSVDLLQYANVLLDLEQALKGLYEDSLVPFGKELGKILTRPSDYASASKRIRVNIPDLDQLTKKYADCYKGRTNLVHYWDAVKRQSDIVNLLNTLADLAISSKRQPSKLIAKKVGDLSDALYKIRDMMNDPNSSVRPSSQVIKSVSDITYTLAQLVSFYSNTNHSVAELTRLTEDALLDVLSVKK